MKRRLSWIAIGFTLIIGQFTVLRQTSAQTIGFEDLSLEDESFEDGRNLDGHFDSCGVRFNNQPFAEFPDFYFGWYYSNTTDTATPGAVNQSSAVTGAGADGSTNYGVAFVDAFVSYPDEFFPEDNLISWPGDLTPVSMQVTNTTYAALSMANGDAFAKKFGGETGDDPDYFKLIVVGVDDALQTVGVVEHFLADYRFADNNLDFIVDDWQPVDLAPLAAAGATGLSFALDSSDRSDVFGLNTPGYFAMDDLVLRPTELNESTPVGDANLDGVVNRADLAVVAQNYRQAQCAGWRHGDFDFDGRVSLIDIASLQANIHVSSLDASPASVPEPTSLTLLLVGWLCFTNRRGRH